MVRAAPSVECCCELVGEFAPAARILVLELHARRPERVTFGGLRHALLLEILGGCLGFFGKLSALIGSSAIAAAGDHQRASAVRIGKAKMQSRKAAHRQSDDMRLVDFERVEHRTDVVTRPLLRVTLSVIGHVGWRIAPRVVRDAAVALAEIAHLRLIGAQVAGEFVHQDDRNSAADLFIIELDSIVGCQCGMVPSRSRFQKLKLRAETPASIVTTDPLL